MAMENNTFVAQYEKMLVLGDPKLNPALLSIKTSTDKEHRKYAIFFENKEAYEAWLSKFAQAGAIEALKAQNLEAREISGDEADIIMNDVTYAGYASLLYAMKEGELHFTHLRFVKGAMA